MNPNEQEIERLLRRATKPSPPAGLKEELLARVSVAGANASHKSMPRSAVSGGWLRRWWPVLMPAAASLVCCVVLAFQQMEIRELRESIAALLQKQEEAAMAEALISTPEVRVESVPDDRAAKEWDEIARLKNRVTQFTAELTALELVQKGNEELRAKLNAPPTLSQEELDALAKAKERAMSINCVNNLKQFGLAVRIWQMEHNNVNSPDFLSMSNELNTPKILVCPADTNRVVAKSWEDFSEANCSYEYLTPSVSNADRDEPMRVQTRCPLHGHVGMSDGSVQIEVAKKHPERLKERGGKLYYEHQ